MEAVLEKKLAIDKSNWKPVKFGNVVREPKESIKDPEKAGVKHVVGLEHIEPEDIHLRSFNTLDESTTFTKAFKKGDVLFGRRRAYLKKATLAPFDGICSGDITVFRAKDNLLPELLPFVVNNEKFFDYAVKHSAGGLSPRVKFKDLANYDFLLPPKEEQAKLAELLWAMDKVVEKEKKNLSEIINFKKSFFNDQVYTSSSKRDKYFGQRKPKHPVVKLGKLLKEIQYGISESLDEEGDIPVLRMNNLQDGKLILDDLKFSSLGEGEISRFILRKGDVLFNRTNSYDLVGKVSLFNVEGKYSFASYLIRLQADRSKLDPRFLNFYLNSSVGVAKIRKYRTPGVSQSNINAQNLKHIPIPLPEADVQYRLMDDIENLEVAERDSSIKIDQLQVLQKSLINQIF